MKNVSLLIYEKKRILMLIGKEIDLLKNYPKSKRIWKKK